MGRRVQGCLGRSARALLVGDGTSLTGGGGVVKTVTVATTVEGVTAASSQVTTDITFSPALGAGTYARTPPSRCCRSNSK